MKKILLILFIILFTQPSWSNDYRGVENCKDIIFNSPELKVKVSDNDDLGWVSILNRTDIKDIEFKNIYIEQKDDFNIPGTRIKYKDRYIDLCLMNRTIDTAYLIQKKNVYRILMQDDDISLVFAMLTMRGCGTSCYMSGVYEIVFNLSQPDDNPYLRGQVIHDAGFPSDWFMDALHFNEAFELARIQGFSFFYWRGNKYKVK